MKTLQPQITELVELMAAATKSGRLNWTPIGYKHYCACEGFYAEVVIAIDPPTIISIAFGADSVSRDYYSPCGINTIPLLAAIYEQENAAGLSPLTEIIKRLKAAI